MIKTFRALVAPLVISLFASMALAGAGESSSGSRGGGDPDAVEFLATLSDISAALPRINTGLSAQQTAHAALVVEQLAALMDDPKRTSIRLTSATLRDASGTEKLAIYSTNPLQIIVNRKAWKAADESTRMRLAALELYGLVGIESRYTLSAQLDPSLVVAIRGFHASGLDITNISVRSNIVTLSSPHIKKNSPLDYHQAFVYEKTTDSLMLVNLFCMMYGFGAGITGQASDIVNSLNGPVSFFDSTGLRQTLESLPGDRSQFLFVKSVACEL